MNKSIAKVNKGHYRVFTNVAKDIIFSEPFQSLKKYVQHGDTSTFKHLLGVAYTAFMISEKLRLKTDVKDLIAGALLHDYVFYDWHTHGDKLHGFHHPEIAANNAAKDFDVSENALSAIRSHMWPLTISKVPKSTEAALVCVADKICSIKEMFQKIKPRKYTELK